MNFYWLFALIIIIAPVFIFEYGDDNVKEWFITRPLYQQALGVTMVIIISCILIALGFVNRNLD